MYAEDANNPPHRILGLTIRSHTRIYLSYVIPNVLEVLVYIVQVVADSAVSYQHFNSHQPDFGWATLTLIFIPPFVTCLIVLSSKSRWFKAKRNATRVKFVCMQLLQMLLFPFFVIYRSAKLIFWSIEALFHDDDDKERMECLRKAEECSTCELYRLIQAYGQSAPQIILQIFHMLTQDLFRNFQTTNVQAISLVFSAIDLASITATYQRFESQKLVGRHYPWSTKDQIQKNILKIRKNKCFQEECMRKKRDSERALNKFTESDKIMENFKARNQDNITDNPRTQGNNANGQESLIYATQLLSHTVQVHGFAELENGVKDEQTALLAKHLTDDDKIKTNSILHLNVAKLPESLLQEFDMVPNSPPPLPPKTSQVLQDNQATNDPQLDTQTSSHNAIGANKRHSKAFSQLETFKDMLLVNAQLYIKENVPRPPKMLIKRIEDHSSNLCKTPSPQSPKMPQDAVDFFQPGPTKAISGLQQDDFAAKTIAFCGWIAFVTMRLLSLSTFCVFFPKAFFITVAAHYLLLLASLYLESRFKGDLNRTFFYFLLAYVYVYVLLEFRVKFKHVRIWFAGYFLLSMIENVTMTMIWYAREEFESWWFDFIFEGIVYSGIISLLTIIVYYFILKPSEVIFLVEDQAAAGQSNQQTHTTATMTTET